LIATGREKTGVADEQIHEEQNIAEDRFMEEEQKSRGSPLLALLSFSLAVLLLLYFFSPQLDSLVKMMLLCGALVFGMLGVLLREKRIFGSPPAAVEHEPDDDQTLELTDFEQLVQEALDSIPAEFHEQMENLIVLVENEPDTALKEKLYENETAEHSYLLGLYQGIPLTHQSYGQVQLPERITIYQHNIERYCQGDPERIREQVRSTVLHEVAHHFGMDHHDMPIWVR
jgi:predicted Zn-dependent protease with MMP-like domain